MGKKHETELLDMIAEMEGITINLHYFDSAR
jgi:hypothetical protein